ncbi:hypothetical protein [Bradyrhizobium stylosanthis]|uniref:Uncharacterized protein n=1 Tax=Bradyrhizobium stylosanthis TaxID=1803665 RepID=A0A560E397_9BRAD|nr:hypothetical protein [Bradyrhizobium stylosanthis]TWB03862.1 hypothetical protein FBZ96_102335 [Bradyrhizobium stylosanthis]
MRMASAGFISGFRDIVARVGAAIRSQREIDARRALQRYRHLLGEPHDTLLLSEVIPVSNEKDISGHANRSDACERTAGHSTFERA